MESLLIAIIILFQAMGLVFLFLLRRKIYQGISEAVKDEIITWLSTKENQEAIGTWFNQMSDMIVQKVKMAAIGQLGGITKGVSHQLKNLEKDLIAEGIVQANPQMSMVAPIVVKYLDKYPILKVLLPALLQSQGQPLSPAGSPAGEELGKIG